MSTVAGIHSTEPLRTILLDRLRDGSPRVGEAGRSLADVIQRSREKERLLGIEPPSATETAELAVAESAEEVDQADDSQPAPAPDQQVLVPTSNGLQIQYFTGQQVDLLI